MTVFGNGFIENGSSATIHNILHKESQKELSNLPIPFWADFRYNMCS